VLTYRLGRADTLAAVAERSHNRWSRMPIYEYFCESCDRRFERLRPMTAAGQSLACPTCGSMAEAAVSRTARITGGSEDDGADLSPPPAPTGHGHSHGHSHGAGGHTH